MTMEEIKEILDYIDDRIIPNEKWDKIKDYITNLQQKDFESQKEITKLKDKLEQQRKEYQDTYKDVRIEIKEKNERIANLQQENERLNNKVKEQSLLLIEFQDMEQKVDIYKSRCEKANKYINEEIKKIQEHQYSTGVRRLTKIQNILNGSDGK